MGDNLKNKNNGFDNKRIIEELAWTNTLDSAQKEIDELSELSEGLLLNNEELELEINSLKEKNSTDEEKISELNKKILENEEKIFSYKEKISELNKIFKNLLNEEIINFHEVVTWKKISSEHLTSEKKSEILISGTEIVSGIKTDNLNNLKKIALLGQEKKDLENDILKNWEENSQLIILLSEKNIEISKLELENENSFKKFLKIAKKLFPEENFSEENFLINEIFPKILEKINELIENFAKWGQEELNKKNEKIWELSDLIDKIKWEKNYLVANKKELENEIRKLELNLKWEKKSKEALIWVINNLNKELEVISKELEKTEEENKILKEKNQDLIDENNKKISKIIWFEKDLNIFWRKLKNTTKNSWNLLNKSNNAVNNALDWLDDLLKI